MKKLLTILLILLFAAFVFADVDTFEGQSGTDTWEGQNATDTREGQSVASGAPSCAGGVSAGLGLNTTDGNRQVDSEDVLIFDVYTTDTSSDGTVNQITVNMRMLDSGNYINCGIWEIENASTATLLADGPNTGEGNNTQGQAIVVTLDDTVCLESAKNYAIGCVVDGSDTDFDIHSSGWTSGGNYWYIAMSGGATLSNFDPSSATEVSSGYNISVIAEMN